MANESIIMWYWQHHVLHADVHESLTDAFSVEAHQDGRWSCEGFEVVTSEGRRWVARDSDECANAIEAIWNADDAGQPPPRPLIGHLRVIAPWEPVDGQDSPSVRENYTDRGSLEQEAMAWRTLVGSERVIVSDD